MLVWVVVLSPLAICLAYFFVRGLRGNVQKSIETAIQLPILCSLHGHGKINSLSLSLSRRLALRRGFTQNLKT
jgi:hypothetical protein